MKFIILVSLGICTPSVFLTPVPAKDKEEDKVDPEEDARFSRGTYPIGVGNYANSIFSPHGNYHPQDLLGQEYPSAYRITPKVDCFKSYMVVSLTFSRPFYGIIYPKEKYGYCNLFTGKGETQVSLSLGRVDCGAAVPQNYYPTTPTPLDALIVKELMIQWEPDFIQEFDVLLTVRCDAPEDFRKQVVFDIFNVAGLKQDMKANKHPGPELYMEVQKGQGPRGVPLQGPVYLGDPLTLLFTVHDESFEFDTNVLNCWASDGNAGGYNYGAVRYGAPRMHVIERSCSQKPKVFSNFQKENTYFPGAFTSTQWCYFKAFRFPSSPRILITCEVEVCYRKCPYEQHTCSAYNPEHTHYRGRRSVGNETDDIPVKTESVSRSIEVLMPNDTSPIGVILQNSSSSFESDRYKPTVVETYPFYEIVAGITSCLLFLALCALATIYWKLNLVRK
ncbi:uncharacterized protein LOC136039781 [Artemia franciscana]|uniref:ZP domain-containing protein n=1 Tax=Artemia franciscana TaxID=6661 RepID=A0AA88I3S2_ARTSF|nr:hypothetical protein QYM36_009150 [Artemia franciscana]